MSTMQEFASGSTLFGGNAPYIEEQYERYLANPAEVPGEWRMYFDSLRDGAADVAHAPIVQSFIELARNRKVAGAMVDATTMHKQVLVLAAHQQVPHARHVPRGLGPAAAAGKVVYRRP